jgi:hypothetical protein
MRAERKNLTQPADLWQAAEAVAQAAGISLSEWVGQRMVAGLPAEVRRQLAARPGVGRPKSAPECQRDGA